MTIKDCLRSDFSDKVRLNIDGDKLALGIIIVIALALRLIFFNGLNWDDDPDYVWRAYQVKSGQGFIYQDNNGFRIGTFYPAAIMYFLFGVNNFSCGAYSLIVSLLSILAIYSLGKLLFTKTTGLAAALLLAFYPLDIELASRLMPDGLLSGFSLFSFYFLIKADIINIENDSLNLISKGSYVACGLLLAWCTLVNMSSFVLFIYLLIYLIFSFFLFKNKFAKIGFGRGFFKIFLIRYLIIGLALLAVLIAEGLLYKIATGTFLYKYDNTITHYAGDHGFNKDLWTYPRIMFHVDNSGKFRFQGKENSYYGFYFIFVLFALFYILIRPNKNIIFVSLWLLVLWSYLQWGSMSFSSYLPLHRLPRHLALLTPPMILCLAYFLTYFQPKEVKKYLSLSILAFLLISSLVFSYYRHQALTDSVRPQNTINNYLKLLNPKIVYASNDTIAYQRFINKYKEVRWEYIDIRMANYNRNSDAYVIIGEHRNWVDTARTLWTDVQSIPANWQLTKTLEVPGTLDRPPYEIKLFKLLTEPIQALESQNCQLLIKRLMAKYPLVIRENSKLYSFWECPKVDGIEELILQGAQIKVNHIAFNMPQGINYKIYDVFSEERDLDFQVIKEYGRGNVQIIQHPKKDNNYTMRIRIDDGPFPSFDYYRIYVISNK